MIKNWINVVLHQICRQLDYARCQFLTDSYDLFSRIFQGCFTVMGLLPNTQNCGLRMRRECREGFPRHKLQRKPLVSDPDMYHVTCVTSWCMSGSLTRGGEENVPSIPGTCATRDFTYLKRGPLGELQMKQPWIIWLYLRGTWTLQSSNRVHSAWDVHYVYLCNPQGIKCSINMIPFVSMVLI